VVLVVFVLVLMNFKNKTIIIHLSVYSADIKNDALKCYNITELPNFDLLCAGFPCQPFSSAGNKKGFKDNRGGLIFKILEICKKYKPVHIILENVSNLITLDKGKYIQQICDIFNEIGYHISYKN
jgi:DNA (cytosine-5)-methyltransferase 1